jgi:hypothetical protein
MGRILGALGGGLLIAALIGGWWAIDRVQEHLPAPVNAVIGSVQNAGAPYSGPILQPLDPAQGTADPLEVCPEFRDDVRRAEQAIAALAPVSQAQSDANNELISREVTRMADGGAPRPLAETGVAAALRDQATALDATASALAGADLQTDEARSLATGISAAATRVAEANRRFVEQGTGTRAAWQQWMDAVGGPISQVEAASRGFTKCPA